MDLTERGVSVIICAHNAATRIEQTLACLATQDAGGVSWEVILVDNASNDGTSELTRAVWPRDSPAPLRVIRETTLGLSHARRRGVQESRYSAVAFVDDDNWIDRDFVRVARWLMDEHPTVGVIGGDSVATSEEALPSWFHSHAAAFAVGRQGDREGDVTVGRGWLWGAGMVLRTDAIAGLYQDGFRHLLSDRRGDTLVSGGDVELCYALRLRGWRLWYSPSLRLRHFMPRARMHEQYLVRLFRGFGLSDLWLELYRPLLESRFDRWMRLPVGARWAYVAAHDLRDAAQVRVALAASQGTAERRGLKLELARTHARLRERLQYRGAWDQAFERLRSQSWIMAPK